MKKPDVVTKNTSLKTYNGREPFLFVIPNPFEDYLQKKSNWYSKIKRIEGLVKAMRVRMNEIASRQVESRQAIREVTQYCTTLKHRPVTRRRIY